MLSLDSSRLRAFARSLFAALAVALAVAALPVSAHAEELRCTGHETFDASLVARAQQRVSAGSSDVALQNISTTGDLGLSTTGEARVVVIRVSFPASVETGDAAMTIPADQTQDDLRAVFNGGTGSLSADYPYESLHNYYERASYGKFDIRAAYVVDYTAQYGRSHYTNNVSELFYEALAGVEGQVDYNQCDANNDGKIDGVYLQYAGPDTGWGTTWWPSMHTLTDDSHTFGASHKIARGAMLLQSNLTGMTDFSATVIHETGHLLGLPDLYSYNRNDLGLQANDMMFNSTGDIDSFCKWMLDWIDEDKIVYACVSDRGVDVRRGGQADIKHYDGAADEVLPAFSREGDVSATGGFIAVSDDESILEGNLLCNFYLMEYRQRAGNDKVSLGETPMGEGVRIYRMQAAYNERSGFVHSNAYGNAHDQLIEVLTPTEGPDGTLGLFALWQPGSSVTPASTPSTNFGENVITGFSGIALSIKQSGDGAGRVSISYQAAPEETPLTMAYAGSAVNGSSGSVTLELSRDAVRNDFDNYRAKLVVDGVEYNCQNWTKLAGERTFKVYVNLAPGIIKPTSKVQVKMPAGSFVLAFDESGVPSRVSDELVCDVPTPNVCAIQETGSYANATVPADNARLLSNIIDVKGSKYFLAYAYSYEDYADSLGLYRISADGKTCEKVELEGATGLSHDCASTFNVVSYGDSLLFVRMCSYNTLGDEWPRSFTDAVIDITGGRVLAKRSYVGQEVYLVSKNACLVPMGDGVVSARTATDGSWTGETYCVQDGQIVYETSSWADEAAKRVSTIVDAGEGYLATAGGGAGQGAEATVSLYAASELSNVSSLGEVAPRVSVKIADNCYVNAVRVAGGRLCVLACNNHMADGRDNFVNELSVWDLAGNLISTSEMSSLPLLFASTADLRVSSSGALAICQSDANEAVTLGVRGVQSLFDASLAGRGSLTNYKSSVGAWLGDRWLSVDYPLPADDGPMPDQIPVTWALTAPIGAADPAGPSDPSGPSAPSSSKGSKATGALANTGDRTIALVGAVLAAGLVLAIAGIIVARRKRR